VTVPNRAVTYVVSYHRCDASHGGELINDITTLVDVVRAGGEVTVVGDRERVVMRLTPDSRLKELADDGLVTLPRPGGPGIGEVWHLVENAKRLGPRRNAVWSTSMGRSPTSTGWRLPSSSLTSASWVRLRPAS
jgi:hypothetical protein